MDEFLDSFGNLETYLKFAFVAATYGIWGPVLKTIVREIKLATDVPRGSLLDKLPPTPPPRAPGDDPWVSIPLAAYRSRQASREPSGAANARGRAGRSRRAASSAPDGSRPPRAF